MPKVLRLSKSENPLLVSRLKWKAIIFGDGRGGYFFQAYRCVEIPEIELRVHGFKNVREATKRQFLVSGCQDSFETIEDAYQAFLRPRKVKSNERTYFTRYDVDRDGRNRK